MMSMLFVWIEQAGESGSQEPELHIGQERTLQTSLLLVSKTGNEVLPCCKCVKHGQQTSAPGKIDFNLQPQIGARDAEGSACYTQSITHTCSLACLSPKLL